jgi:hypothetical protein
MFLSLRCFAQPDDDFNDGDLLNGPVWQFNSGDFFINPDGVLQSASYLPNHTFSIFTTSSATYGVWRFKIRMDFNTSGANYTDVFLMASDTAFQTSFNTGYFVRIGGTNDAISLFRKDAGGQVLLAESGQGVVQNGVWYTIQITRSSSGRWMVQYTVDGFTDYIIPVTDTVYNHSMYFGISIKQSTASFFGKHFIDDIQTSDYIPDTIPPNIQQLMVVDSVTIRMLFSEPVLMDGYLPSGFYVETIGFPEQVELSGTECVLRFRTAFPERVPLYITVTDIRDYWDNVAAILQDTVYFIQPSWGDVVIHEIFADPAPPVQMPDAEWIEVRNTTAFPLSLKHWKICSSTRCAEPLDDVMLFPDSLLILTSTQSFDAMRPFGSVVGVRSFPSLNNSGDVLQLNDASGAVIHTVSYSDNWYRNPIKRTGGWSLEMKDVRYPCVGADNWGASEDVRGATPGSANSISGNIIDNTPPQWLRVYASDSITVQLFFSEPLAHGITALAQVEILNASIFVDDLYVDSIFSDRLYLKLSAALQPGTIYSMRISGITDCAGNVMADATKIIALAVTPGAEDLIVNEILFNPNPSGTDFVEVYNRSNKVIDLQHLFIGNVNSMGEVSNLTRVHESGYALYPESFVVLSKDKTLVQREYYTHASDVFVDVPDLPSYNDNEGTVVLMNQAGEEIDRVSYQDKWHFRLLRNTEGVSLERTHYEGHSNHATHWHSAAATVGYATPGLPNSQLYINPGTDATIQFSSDIVSPNNDGRDDYLIIDFSFPETGYLSNISIFDLNGIIVHNMHRNMLNGTSGYWKWDGLNSHGKPLNTGRYIVVIEVYNLKGKRSVFKKVLTIVNQ